MHHITTRSLWCPSFQKWNHALKASILHSDIIRNQAKINRQLLKDLICSGFNFEYRDRLEKVGNDVGFFMLKLESIRKNANVEKAIEYL